MAGPDPIENIFVARAGAIAGVRSALDYDPNRLPALPAVTMHFLGGTARDHQTGPAQEVRWAWRVRLYVPYKSGQGSEQKRSSDSIKSLLPEVLKITRADPGLGGTCDEAWIVDPEEEPDFDSDQKNASKDFLLYALTEEV